MAFLSVDGVSQGPGARDEDTDGGFAEGGWFYPYGDQAFGNLVVNWVAKADAFLFGRRTYEGFARHWPKLADPADPVASRLNGLPKYVASNSLVRGEWGPSMILAGDVPRTVAELKRQPGRELQIHGSARLAQSLLAAGTIDELRLVIAPVVVGSGRRLFASDGMLTGLRLLSHETTPSGLAIQVYEPAEAPIHRETATILDGDAG